MRLEETSVNGTGQAVREALARKSDWEQHGPGHWGYGVALDVLALERRISALERFSGTGKSNSEESDSDVGTGDPREPVAWAVMSGRRAYDTYDTQGEAEAICRWLCDEESGDIWRVVPLVPATLTDEEREAIAYAAKIVRLSGKKVDRMRSDVMAALLAKSE